MKIFTHMTLEEAKLFYAKLEEAKLFYAKLKKEGQTEPNLFLKICMENIYFFTDGFTKNY